MLVSELIAQIKNQVHDISGEYDDDILIKYINTAIKSASYALAAAKSSSVLYEVSVNNGIDKPSNFIKFAGIYPVRITAGKFYINEPTISNMTVRYYGVMPNVAAATDTMPFSEERILLYIEQYASILALNRNEFDVSTDTAILGEIKREFISDIEEG